MATRVLADEELERLRGSPDISREELFRYFTLTRLIEFCRLVGKPTDSGDGLATVTDELHEAVSDWRRCWPVGTGRCAWTRAGIW